ncbi:MAG TPA: pyridoxal phosphate-dependent aminotransferase family protein [bacterium]|nr:pyridoxal phosphate-dependent aminotransferase family protein [bacterium]HOL47217.1 pyridoxal phosphate-dependent aminotransferase family protein [bacterium]HPQ18274.1 pyridoxal phosphate-dependent aminotransferase family protein [bacterium]
MGLLTKCEKYDAPERVRAMGIYPYFRPIEGEQSTLVRMNGKEVLMFGSNSYLGLTNHPKVKEAAINAIKKYGVGCAGSRFLNGTLTIHIELEERLAAFVEKEAALVYSTGFQVNLGVISALVSNKDFVITDRLDHASIIDGCRLSFGETKKFKHNDMNDLERILNNTILENGKLIVVDGIFSMEGDIANLPEICRLAKKYNACVMVDDAHSIGVLGEKGRGTANHFKLTNEVQLIMGTFSKSLASVGGFIASDKVVIEYLKHNSRPLIFSASLPPANAATVLACLDIIESEPERIDNLWKNTNYMLQLLKEHKFDVGNSCTPIIPIIIGDDLTVFKMCMILQEKGVFVNPVVSPATPPNKALIRLSLMATHTKEQIEIAVEKIIETAKELSLYNR